MWGEKYDAYYGAKRGYPADPAGPSDDLGRSSPSEAGGEEGKEAEPLDCCPSVVWGGDCECPPLGEAVMQSVAPRQQDCVDSEAMPWFMQMLREMPWRP